jgi:hypothetical protein
MKVLISRDDDESMVASMGPNRTVRAGCQAYFTDMDRARIQVSERPDKTGRQILVKQEPR